MQLPIHLAYQASIDPSDVIFLVVWPDGSKSPLKIHSRKINGMKEGIRSAYKENGDIDTTIKAEQLAEGNIHEIDFCNVPYGAKALECCFSVSFLPKLLEPLKCSDNLVKQQLSKLFFLYHKKIGLKELVNRYLINICNASWLWENPSRAYSTTIEISPWPWEDTTLVFEELRKNYPDPSNYRDNMLWNELVQLVINTLTTSNELCVLEVKATMQFPTCAPIRPSQVFKESTKGEKNRQYQSTEIDNQISPIFGCFKTGAAIAMIDNWYPNAEKMIRVGHYGVDKQNTVCYRAPETGKDFFSLLKRSDEFIEMLNSEEDLTDEIINDLHFVIANLIKGGLFQQKGS
ncbi:type I-F CRISPR-associated protein Csy3 [Shewanella subflava]|uniref:Type I-F CRISPR-associated protein Csy3 n=1 Tax=Shewanella subflava TaxID=2986476 RepID=A0ABT3I972_9GAMM|nr:type I-F CRISPR-associated protein Csy3 [Shewanella subflava]MCW3172624.1 type I-F CRISPR-associated protein Csy3 [Shewanella subflava]